MENRISSLTTFKFSKICRVCLSESDEMYSLYTSILQDGAAPTEHTYICEMLMSISSIKILVEDSLPPMICSACVELAKTAYTFQQQCNQSQQILEDYIMQLHNTSCQQDEIDRDNSECDVLQYITTINLFDKDNEDLLKLANEIADKEVIEETPVGLKTSSIRKHNKDKPLAKPRKKRNIKVVNDMDDKSYDCYHCGKKYKQINTLKIHLRSHSLDNPFECKFCQKKFRVYGALKYHIRDHTGHQTFSCEICGKCYKQAGSLTAHMRVHTGQRPFLCSVCGRGFRQAPDLGYHMRIHTEERPYMCNVCGKTMRMQCHLVQHMRMHTGERPFKCDKCDKAFPSTTRLKRHTIIHTGLKPYSCDVCKKSFNRVSSLKVHSKIHTDERPFVCSVCGKAFIQAHALKGHLNTHLTADTLDLIKQE